MQDRKFDKAAQREKQLDALVADHAKYIRSPATTNWELEIRFSPTPEYFQNLVAWTKTMSPIRHCSCDIISQSSGDHAKTIRQLVFDCSAGIKVSENYGRKMRLANVVFDGYKVTLSSEDKLVPTPSNNDAHVRFKNRVSVIIENWRLDLTAVRSGGLGSIGMELKQIRDRMFRTGTPEDAFSHIDWDICKPEVELEYIGESPVTRSSILAIASIVLEQMNPGAGAEVEYRARLFDLAAAMGASQQMLTRVKSGKVGLKQLGNNVVSLSKKAYYADVYPTLDTQPWFVTEKADGVRAMVHLVDGVCAIVTSGEVMIKRKTGVATTETGIVADCELIDGKLYMFDLITPADLPERIELMYAAALAISDYCPIEVKKYIRVNSQTIGEIASGVYSAAYPYKLDGLILSSGGNYSTTRNYKWKPIGENTIDFLAIACPSELLGKKPYVVVPGKKLYLLYVGMAREMRSAAGIGVLPFHSRMFPRDLDYGPVQFSPSVNPFAYLFYSDQQLDGKIVELAMAESAYVPRGGVVPCTQVSLAGSMWELHRVRDDRRMEPNYFGNNFVVAETTFMNYIDPLALADLSRPSTSYFRTKASGEYVAAHRFKRFIVDNLISTHVKGAEWVIDIAAGRGGDLHRYVAAGVHHLLAIDSDKSAIVELVGRKFTKRGGEEISPKIVEEVLAYDKLHDVEYTKQILRAAKTTAIHALVADMKNEPSSVISLCSQFGLVEGTADAAICNFAIHYLCDKLENMQKIVAFAARVVRVGGRFMFTSLDGAKVHSALAGVTRWESRDNEYGPAKYAIMKKYTSTTLTSSGQMISVKLPFTTEMYDEPLCNVDKLIDIAQKVGFTVEVDSSMLDWLDKFASAMPDLRAKLTPVDIEYIGMHRCVVLKLTKLMTGGTAYKKYPRV